MSYLWTNQVFLKNFGDHVEKVTERVKEASLAASGFANLPVKRVVGVQDKGFRAQARMQWVL